MTPQAAYDELLRRSREEAVLASCVALLGWDELTYMPPGGVQGRGNQLAYLAGLQHDKGTDPRVGELLAAVDGSQVLADADVAVNVREIQRAYRRSLKLPRSLVEELARVAPAAQQQWALSRQEDDFASFRPWLEKIVALKRQEAECLGYVGEPYDALLEDFEPGLTSAGLVAMFTPLAEQLTLLLGKIRQSRKKPKLAILRRQYPVEGQRVFATEAAIALGFDFQRGRLDTAVHPFSTQIASGDCRIAIRYHPTQFSDGFFALLHEVGHGLYEQGLDPEWEGTPLGAASSLGIHESQSRLWENFVGRGLSFWKHFFPRARQTFPDALGKVSVGDFHFAINAVQPTLNRVAADEVTYNLHIMSRVELERALLRGDLAVADLPGAWKESYERHLGVTPTTDADGCLQDGHWSEGLFGYFPTYTLGNLFAAQLFDRAKSDLANLEAGFAKGDFSGLLDWLRERVHRHGSRYMPGEMMMQATGSPPSAQPLVDALTRKYTELYAV